VNVYVLTTNTMCECVCPNNLTQCVNVYFLTTNTMCEYVCPNN